MAESLDDIRKKSRDELETKDVVDSHSKDSTSVDDGGIPECAVCLQTCVHPCRLPCGHIFCFLCIKGTVATTHPGSIRRCAMCRREIPSDFLEKPTLLRPIFPTPAIAPNPSTNGTRGTSNTDSSNAPSSDDHEGYQWFYEGRNGWWQYDERTGKQLEAAYSSGEVSCELIICGSLYVIDLENLVQYRKVGIGRRRRIKRDIASAEKKGIAGWWQYDERTSLELEGAYKRGERSCELLIAGFLYVADFDGMVQLRRGDPSRRRRIKRDLASIPVKGVAGLRQRAPAPDDDEANVDLSCYFQQDGGDERSGVARSGRFRNQPHLIQIPPTPANTPGNTSPGVPQTPGANIIPNIIGSAYPDASLRHVVEEMGRLRLGEERLCVRHGGNNEERERGADEEEAADEEVAASVRTSSVLWSPVSPDIASASPWVLTLSSDEDQL